MSYILDALQRAEIERTRGNIPNLKSLSTQGIPRRPRTGRNRFVWPAAALALAVSLGAVLLWNTGNPMAGRMESPLHSAASASFAQVATIPAPSVIPNESPYQGRKIAPSISKESTSTAGTPHQAAKVPSLHELPDDIRSKLPAISISGIVYSDTPEQRLLLVNGQVAAQGQSISDNLWIEEIAPRSAILRIHETRFRITP